MLYNSRNPSVLTTVMHSAGLHRTDGELKLMIAQGLVAMSPNTFIAVRGLRAVEAFRGSTAH